MTTFVPLPRRQEKVSSFKIPVEKIDRWARVGRTAARKCATAIAASCPVDPRPRCHLPRQVAGLGYSATHVYLDTAQPESFPIDANHPVSRKKSRAPSD